MSTSFKHRLAIVVPTKDRRHDLGLMLTSLHKQSVKPAQVVVVDGSEQEVRDVAESFPDLAVEYVRVFPPSLSKQRNAGMARLRADITLAGYLDDDIVLEPEAVERMLAFWESASPDVGGASFNIVNSPVPRWGRLRRLLVVGDAKPGAVLPSGIANAPGYVTEDLETDWLTGGATIWRREIIDRYAYDEWFIGMGYLEDLDYSYNVRRSYRLMVVAGARIDHNSPPMRKDRYYLLGKWQIVNRMYVVRKYRDNGLSVPKAWAMSFSMLVLHLLGGILHADRTYLDRARGNAAGIISELVGRRKQIGGFLK
jgi:glycosyltransferase involved in cell wall biosynthesis